MNNCEAEGSITIIILIRHPDKWLSLGQAASGCCGMLRLSLRPVYYKSAALIRFCYIGAISPGEC